MKICIFLFLLSVVYNRSIIGQNLTGDPVSLKCDTLRSFLILKTRPVVNFCQYNHSNASLGNKILTGSVYVAGYNLAIGAYLVVAPEEVSKWDKKEKFSMKSISKQYKSSFTAAPVFDHDLWAINYIGHPYQGGYYYNSLRSQNAGAAASALFCLGQSLLWEYGWEAGMEQPSIQDLISTPLAGILFGELSHVAAVKMSRNGYKWYEIVFVCIINPAFAINNGFRTKRLPKP